MRTPADPPPEIPDIDTRCPRYDLEPRTITAREPEPDTKPYRAQRPIGRSEALLIAREVVEYGARRVSEGDLEALARYLLADGASLAEEPGGEVVDLIDDGLDAVVIDVGECAP